MIFSQLLLNPSSRQVQRELGNHYELHRSLMSAFPDGTRREQAALLFRIEQPSRQFNNIRVLVQSSTPPDWRWLEQQTDYLAQIPVEQKELIIPDDFIGIFQFLLRANPTRRSSQSGKLTPIFNEEQLLGWMQRKAEQNGFAVLHSNLSIRKMPPLVIFKPENGKRLRIQVQPVDIFGYLEVKDSQLFRCALEAGIGRAKSFGCGLLSIAHV